MATIHCCCCREHLFLQSPRDATPAVEFDIPAGELRLAVKRGQASFRSQHLFLECCYLRRCVLNLLTQPLSTLQFREELLLESLEGGCGMLLQFLKRRGESENRIPEAAACLCQALLPFCNLLVEAL